MTYYNLYKKLKKTVRNVSKNADLKKVNTFKVGGTCKILVEPSSVEEIIRTLDLIKQYKVKYMVLGNGSNILFKGDYDGVIIRLTRFNRIEFHGRVVVAYGGAMLGQVIKECVSHALRGLEEGVGIPATVGGAVAMNASSRGFSIDKTVSSVMVYSKGHIKVLDNSECKFGYRSSIFTEEDIILRVEFKLNRTTKKEIKDNMQKVMEFRRTLPTLPSAGCVFKNPCGYSAGKLIEEADLKGCSIGGAMVSPKHANFIINCGGASGADVFALIEHIQNTVKRVYDIGLVPEIKIID